MGSVTSIKHNEVSLEKLKELFPNKKNTLNQQTVDLINAAQQDPEFDGVSIISSMMTHKGLIDKHSASMAEYVNAVRFCGIMQSDYKMTATEAYKRVFFDREHVQKCLKEADGDTSSSAYRELTSAASRYNKSPLVVDIMTQADVPLYLLLGGLRFEMSLALANEARTAPLAKDRIAAMDKFLTHVKPPENIKLEMDIGVKKDSIIDDYEQAMAKMVAKQKELIALGANVKDIANASIVKRDEDIIDADIGDNDDK